MVTSNFGILLEEIGRELGIENLHPDKHDACLILMKNKVKIQMEIDTSSEYLILATDFLEIEAGTYRKLIFTEALKANAMPHPRFGTFAWSRLANHLVMFKMFPLKGIKAADVAEYIGHFSLKAFKWKEAIEQGSVPIVEMTGSTKSTGMFGL